jgi:hypothetical protein
MAHKPRPPATDWGVFPTQRGRRTVLLDVAPLTGSGRIDPRHTFGRSCKCRPRVEISKHEIPIVIHDALWTEVSS